MQVDKTSSPARTQPDNIVLAPSPSQRQIVPQNTTTIPAPPLPLQVVEVKTPG